MDDGEKLRRLSKYEARQEVFFRDAGIPEMEFFSPFGPLIGRTRVPAWLIDHVNDHVDGILPPDEGSELLLSEEFCRSGGDDSLVQWVSSKISRYVQKVEQPESVTVRLQQFWVVSQYAETASPMHFHSGDISGVMYLKVPAGDSSQDQKNYISGRQAGYINFLIGGKQRFSRSLISFRPVVGELLLFPAWLLHGAEPFRGSGERRSLAFNAAIQE
ncbi:MAG: putative 2OG-Fe(II) oxygenase [Fuerstiella sp.]